MVEITVVGYKKSFSKMFEAAFAEMNRNAVSGKKLDLEIHFYSHPINNQELSNGRNKYFLISSVSLTDFIKIFRLFGEFSRMSDWEFFLNCPEARYSAEVRYAEEKYSGKSVIFQNLSISSKAKNSSAE